MTPVEPPPDDDATERIVLDEPPRITNHDAAVRFELERMRARAEARDLFDVERRATEAGDPFDAGTLAQVLARPAEPPHRVTGLIASEASTLVVAMRKIGKSTLLLNLARCLLTGEDFLDHFPVRPVTGRVAVLNFEVSAAQLARWADEIGVPTDQLLLVNLRGRRNPLSHPSDRERLADLLREHDVESLMVDPFGRAYTGKSQNDSGEVGAWLTDLDVFARAEVGAKDLILAAHAGWDGERTRGSSALEDWADSIVTLVRDKDDETQRFLKATGRDVDVDEAQLGFDPTTRLLSLTGAGSRRQARDAKKIDDLVLAVVQQVAASPGINGTGLGVALRAAGAPFQRGDEIKAARIATNAGRLRIEDGARGAKLYFLSDVPRRPPTSPTGGPGTSPHPLLVGGGRPGVPQDTDLPQDESLLCPIHCTFTCACNTKEN